MVILNPIIINYRVWIIAYKYSYCRDYLYPILCDNIEEAIISWKAYMNENWCSTTFNWELI